jgi:deoxyinosine 3'endonuclease (endonuclease V)
MTLPYISGFLAFREVPFLLQLLQELKDTHPQWMPQVILVDGNGKLHHRGQFSLFRDIYINIVFWWTDIENVQLLLVSSSGFGLACHLGVLTGIPTVGVSKTLLNVDGLSNAIVNKTFKTECERGGQFVKLIGNSGVVHGAVRIHDQHTNSKIKICANELKFS